MKTSLVHFCFQEATLSAVVITFYMILSDLVEEYIDKQSIPKWQKYGLTMMIMFIASFVSITFLFLVFGYQCDKKK